MSKAAKIVVAWVACLVVSVALANLAVWFIDRAVDNGERTGLESISDRMKKIEDRIEIHESRIEELERTVFWTNFYLEEQKWIATKTY